MVRFAIIVSVSAVCALSVLEAGAATAQELDNVEERLPDQDQIKRGAERGETGLPAEPGALDMVKESEAPLGRFVLTAVNISGANAIASKEFAPLYDDLLAQYVTVADAAALAEAITAMYRKRGYFLSRAVIPAQDAAGGVLKVRIVEGYVEHVDIESDAPADIQQRLAAITTERPLRLATLERTLSLINDLPGVKVLSSKIEPDVEDLARHRLVVKISLDRFEAGFYADNRGTQDAGILQTYLSASASSLLQTGDQLSGGVFFTPEDPGELVLGQISYDMPLGPGGAVFRTAVTTSFFDAGGPRAASEAESRTKQLSASITYPVMRRRRITLSATAGIAGRNFEEEQLGAIRFNDKIRSLYASATFRMAHLEGVTSITGEVAQGLDIFAASTGGALSRADATGEFTKFTAEFGRVQNIAANFSVYASAAAQYSLDPLLASEEFSLGGARYGRAYDYGEFKGDDGVATSVELRYGRKPDINFLKSYQVYSFYDFGAVWNDNVASQFRLLNLSSAGGGLRLTFSNDLRLNAEIAKPLDGAPYTQGDQSWRGFFNLSKSF